MYSSVLSVCMALTCWSATQASEGEDSRVLPASPFPDVGPGCGPLVTRSHLSPWLNSSLLAGIAQGPSCHSPWQRQVMLHCATPKNCHNTGTRLLPPLAALSARSQPGRNMVPACCNDTHVLAFVGRAIHKRQNNQQRHGQVCLQPESGIYHRCGRHCRASSRACCGLHTVTGAASTSVRHQQQHQTM